MDFTPMTTDEVSAIQSGTRSGYAVEAMDAFLASGAEAGDFTESFSGRKLSNVANALKRQASKAAYSNVKVIFTKVDGEDRLVLARTA